MNSQEIIKNFDHTLQSFISLHPCNEINDFFSNLCSFAINNNETFCETIHTRNIREKACEAESLMEKWYATQFIVNETFDLVAEFPYRNNYQKLTDLEISNASIINQTIKNILFI